MNKEQEYLSKFNPLEQETNFKSIVSNDSRKELLKRLRKDCEELERTTSYTYYELLEFLTNKSIDLLELHKKIVKLNLKLEQEYIFRITDNYYLAASNLVQYIRSVYQAYNGTAYWGGEYVNALCGVRCDEKSIIIPLLGSVKFGNVFKTHKGEIPEITEKMSNIPNFENAIKTGLLDEQYVSDFDMQNAFAIFRYLSYEQIEQSKTEFKEYFGTTEGKVIKHPELSIYVPGKQLTK